VIVIKTRRHEEKQEMILQDTMLLRFS